MVEEGPVFPSTNNNIIWVYCHPPPPDWVIVVLFLMNTLGSYRHPLKHLWCQVPVPVPVYETAISCLLLLFYNALTPCLYAINYRLTNVTYIVTVGIYSIVRVVKREQHHGISYKTM